MRTTASYTVICSALRFCCHDAWNSCVEADLIAISLLIEVPITRRRHPLCEAGQGHAHQGLQPCTTSSFLHRSLKRSFDIIWLERITEAAQQVTGLQQKLLPNPRMPGSLYTLKRGLWAFSLMI